MKFEKVFHKGREHFLKNHKIRSKIYGLFCRMFFHCDIPFKTDIDKSVYFCHDAFGVVINPNAKLWGGGGNTERCAHWGDRRFPSGACY